MYNPNENQFTIDTFNRSNIKQKLSSLNEIASFINDNTPMDKNSFVELIEKKIRDVFYDGGTAQDTISNTRTSIIKSLYAMYCEEENTIYPTEHLKYFLKYKNLEAFFKNLCWNYQLPNGAQKRNGKKIIENGIEIKPFHFLLALLKLAETDEITLTRDELGYFVLTSLDVLRGEIKPREVLDEIMSRKGVNEEFIGDNYKKQHVLEQIGFLEQANLISIDKKYKVYINQDEKILIDAFIDELNSPLLFDVSEYNRFEEFNDLRKDWEKHFGEIHIKDYALFLNGNVN